MTEWRNRITRNEMIDPEQLLAHSLNYRLHPKFQQDALEGSLNELGWYKPVIVQEGTDVVIDGHARVTLALRNREPLIPVQYVNLTDAETNVALATGDPISALAEFDRAKYGELLHETTSSEAATMALLAQIAEREGVTPPDFEPVGIEEQGRLDQKSPITCPHCGESFVP